jgi:hypothetical protein
MTARFALHTDEKKSTGLRQVPEKQPARKGEGRLCLREGIGNDLRTKAVVITQNTRP